MSSSSGKKRRRVRRKEVGADENKVEDPPVVEKSPEPEVPVVEVPVVELKPRDDTTVEFKIQDVRDVLSGNAPAAEEEEEDDDDEEWEYVDIDEEEDNDEYDYVIEEVSERKLDSLEQLLADAKTMRADEKKDADGKASDEGDEGGLKIPDSVIKVLSTIVTVDFFVVIGLLLWFLAGIFASYVFKDDTIQIAFNSNFEAFVQPALGILMIGAAASGVLRTEDEEGPME